MKLSRHAFTRYFALHAWTGVLGGLVLYVMFAAGALTLFHEPLERWEEPLAQRPAAPGGLQGALDRGLAALGSTPEDLWLFFGAARGDGGAGDGDGDGSGRGEPRLGYYEGGAWKSPWVDRDGRLVHERERLAHFTYALHYLWHDITGEWLYIGAGLLATVLLIVLVTGVLVHLKDLVRQLHQFRIAKSRRVLWSDMHKVLGVMGLPFQLAYAYTGAFLVLAPLLLGLISGPVLGGGGGAGGGAKAPDATSTDAKAADAASTDAKAADAAGTGAAAADAKAADARATDAAATALLGAPAGGPPEAGPAAPPLPLDELVRLARAARPDFAPAYVRLFHHGHEHGIAEVWGPIVATPSDTIAVRVRARDGAILEAGRAGDEGAAAATRRWIRGLHFARFGGLPLRFVFLGLALATCATILTGNWIWLARRAPGRGNRVLRRLTVGVGAGTWVALGALFLASRAIPLDVAGRGAAEELVFFGVLAGCIGWALAARDVAALWWRQLAAAGALLAPVPLLAARVSEAGLFGAGPRVPAVAALDAALLAAAALLFAIAWRLRRVGRGAASAPMVPSAADLAPSGGHDA